MRLTHQNLLRSVSVVAMLGAASSAYAQDTVEMEEITVTGIRGALGAALDTKRNSDSIVDAISAQDLGKFPDRNVAESLQRVTGVTIQRQFVEGANVIRLRLAVRNKDNRH